MSGNTVSNSQFEPVGPLRLYVENGKGSVEVAARDTTEATVDITGPDVDDVRVELDGEDLVWTGVCDTGEAVSARALGAAPAGLWTEVDAAFQGGHLRVLANGVELANERAGCFTLTQAPGALSVGAGLSGGIDEVEVSPLPRGRTEAAQPVAWSHWRGLDASAESSGLQDGGLVGLDLLGSASRPVVDDARYPCFHLQAETRDGCAHTAGELASDGVMEVMGPLTLHGQVKPDASLAGPQRLLGFEEGPAIWLGEDGFSGVWGEVSVAGGPPAEDRWMPVALAVSHDALRLYVDGVLVDEAALDTGAGATERFAVTAASLSWGGAEGVAWLEESGVDGAAWTPEEALRQHAPWRTEDRPRAVSSQLLWEISDLDWDATCDTLLAQQDAGGLDPLDSELTHYYRSNSAWYCAEAAYQAGDTGAGFELAWDMLENMDRGKWDWSWLQGRSLFWYALAYDRVAALVVELEAADPHTWSPRHAALRRRMASTLHHVGVTGGINEDPVLYDRGYYHPASGYLAANSRLMSTGATGHVALMMPAMADPDFGSAQDHLELALDDLLYDRPGGGMAQGRNLERFLTEGGLYVEGHGYQSDVFTGLTPFFVDWWRSAGGDDLVTTGRIRAMYDANVAAMLPTGHVWPYATGWLGWQQNSALVAELLADSDPDAAEDFRWFEERQHLEETTWTEPAWRSAALGDEALILRSGWDTDDLWLGLLGRTAPCPASHCQEDQLSFMMVAHGAWLLLDPGDGRSYQGTPQASKEAWLQSAEGHNNVLVDGIGPGLSKTFTDLDDPATLTASLLAERAAYGRMEGSVADGLAAGGADHTRRVWLVDNRFFVLVDELEAASSATFSQQFHLGGPTTSGSGVLTTSSPDFSWQTTNDEGEVVELDVVQVMDPARVSLSRRGDGGTNFRYPDVWNHTYVRAQVSGSSSAYLTLLLSGTLDAPMPTASVLQDDEDLRLVEVDLGEDGLVELVYNRTGASAAPGTATSEALLTGTDTESWAFLAEGSTLDVVPDLGLWAGCSLDAAQLEIDGSALSGTVTWPGGVACPLELAWSGGEPTSVEVDGVASGAWTWDGAAGTVVLDPGPTAGFSIR